MGINDYIQIGSKIKKYRIAKGLTQRQMATKLGLSYSTYSNYENNYREPSIEIIKMAAEILELDVHDLLENSGFKDKIYIPDTRINEMIKTYENEGNVYVRQGILLTLLQLGLEPSFIADNFKNPFTKDDIKFFMDNSSYSEDEKKRIIDFINYLSSQK